VRLGNYFGFKKDNFKAIYIFQMMFAILISQCPVWRILQFFKMISFGQPPGVQNVREEILTYSDKLEYCAS
jgi:hypothetical protein